MVTFAVPQDVRWALLMAVVAIGSSCSDSAERPCTERRAIFRLSPAPLTVPNEFLRELCSEGVVESNGCPIQSFRILPDANEEEAGGFMEIASADDKRGCPATFVARVFVGEQWLVLQGTRVESRNGVLVADGRYQPENGLEGHFTVVIGP